MLKEEKRCAKPTKSWVPNVVITVGIDACEILVVRMEIHGDKGYENKDQMKLQVMACSSLAFINKVFGVLIKMDTAELYVYEKVPMSR